MRKRSVIAAAALTLVGIVTDSHAGPPDGFRKNLLDAAASVNAWQIEYEAVVAVGTQGAPVNHRIVAMKKPNAIYHWSTKYGSGLRMTWQDDPLQQRSIISHNREYWEFPKRRAFRVLEVDDKSLFPGSLPKEFLWAAITWWPITRASNHLLAKEPYVVLDVLESEKFAFRIEPEDVKGIPCYVLESPGRSVLWFDAKRIGVLMAREFFSKDTGVPTWRIEMSKHKEIKPGIWCPTELRNIYYDYNAPTEEGRMRRDLDAAFKVLDVRLNEEVPDELFEIPEPKAGAIQAFADGSYKQIAPGGYDYTDDIADWIQRNTTHEKPVSKISATEVIGHVAVYLIALYIFYWCWKS